MGFKKGDLVRSTDAPFDLLGIITKVNPRQTFTGSQLTYDVWWTRPTPWPEEEANIPYREVELKLVARQESE